MKLITTPERYDKDTILQAFFKNVVHHKFMWSRAIVEDQIYFPLTFIKEAYLYSACSCYGKNIKYGQHKRLPDCSWLASV